MAEVDESDGSFLLTRPALAVVNNVDPEHLDHYGTRAALLDAFVEFANGVPARGACVIGIDHPGVQEIAPRLTCRVVRFGFSEDADVRADRVEAIPGGQRVTATLRDRGEICFDLPMPGRHNVSNALAAIAVGLEQGVDGAILAKAIARFAGVSRRYERKGEAAGVQLVDDYAHHPGGDPCRAGRRAQRARRPRDRDLPAPPLHAHARLLGRVPDGLRRRRSSDPRRRLRRERGAPRRHRLGATRRGRPGRRVTPTCATADPSTPSPRPCRTTSPPATWF